MIAGMIVGIVAFALILIIPFIRYRKRHNNGFVVFIHTLQDGNDRNEQIETIIKEPACEHAIDEKMKEFYHTARQIGVRLWMEYSYKSNNLYKAIKFAKKYIQNEKQVAVVCSFESKSDSNFYARGRRTTIVTETKTSYKFIAIAGCGQFRQN